MEEMRIDEVIVCVFINGPRFEPIVIRRIRPDTENLEKEVQSGGDSAGFREDIRMNSRGCIRDSLHKRSELKRRLGIPNEFIEEF